MSDRDGYRFEPGRFLAWLPVYLLIAFTLYVLSAGPMYWTIYEAYFLDGSRWVSSLYFPLVLLSSVSDTFGRWMEWYIGLWVL
jgi:hypothetical protein